MTKKLLQTACVRRSWSDDEKLSILGEVGVDGAGDADVASRHGLSAKRFYQWRTALRRKGLWNDAGPVFLPLEAVQMEHEAPEPDTPSMVEITLRNGRGIRFDGAAPNELLTRLIRLAEVA
jgi:transposase